MPGELSVPSHLIGQENLDSFASMQPGDNTYTWTIPYEVNRGNIPLSVEVWAMGDILEVCFKGYSTSSPLIDRSNKQPCDVLIFRWYCYIIIRVQNLTCKKFHKFTSSKTSNSLHICPRKCNSDVLPVTFRCTQLYMNPRKDGRRGHHVANTYKSVS